MDDEARLGQVIQCLYRYSADTCKLDRILGQIDQYLHQTALIAEKPW